MLPTLPSQVSSALTIPGMGGGGCVESMKGQWPYERTVAVGEGSGPKGTRQTASVLLTLKGPVKATLFLVSD